MNNARALYNEVDKYAAQWLRNLIEAGLIAPGDVAECSIEDLTPNDIRGYTQFHAFAGIGVWSYALRQAGWPDTRPVWTMSCPCQPFSAAGKGAGFADERHLWPAGHWLIQQCRPAKVFGEQVKTAREWLDLVGSDLEALGYAFGAVAASSRAFGAPDDRNRLYWVADAEGLWCNSGEDHRAGLLQAVDVFSEPGDGRAATVVQRRSGPEVIGRYINPRLSRWIMGIPPEWDGSAPTVTPSTRSTRKPSSKRTSKPKPTVFD